MRLPLELGPLRLLRRAGTLAAPVQQARYFVGDGQDSTRQLLDENGAVKDSYFYDSFGVNLPGGQGATENSFKYTGQQQDASGLYYLRARFYNAGTGRFLSQDPEMGGAMDPVSMHRYLYAGADPVNMVDPTGRFSEGLGGQLASMAIKGTLVSGLFGAGSAIASADANALSIGDIGAGFFNGAAGFLTLPYALLTDPAGLATGLVQWHIDMFNVLVDPSKTPLQKATAAVMLASSILAVGKVSKAAYKGFRNRSALARSGAELESEGLSSGKSLAKSTGSEVIDRDIVQVDNMGASTNHCGRCAVATALKRFGVDTSAEQITELSVDGVMRDALDNSIKSRFNMLSDHQVKSFGQVLNIINSAKEGTKFIIDMKRSNAAGRAIDGHVFNAEKLDGQAFTYDSQFQSGDFKGSFYAESYFVWELHSPK